MGAKNENEGGGGGSILFQIFFGHIGLFLIVMAYAVLGAYVFVHLETKAELVRKADKVLMAKQVKDTVAYTSTFIFLQRDVNLTKSNYSAKILPSLDAMEKFILNAVANNNYDGKLNTWTTDWTYSNCLLLTLSIMTTIGYGHIAPKTFEGQMFCIFYALIGCPLFLIFLANIGDAMANSFTYIYSRVCCRMCRSRRYLEEVPSGVSTKTRQSLLDDEVGLEEYMPTSEMFVPIVLNVVILHVYMCAGAFLFNYWERWDLTSAFYFTFITISTIGYGDLSPMEALSDHDSFLSDLRVLSCILFIILGMALLSMAINLMQEQIVTKCQYVAQKIGMSSDDTSVSNNPGDARKDSDVELTLADKKKKGASPYRSLEGNEHVPSNLNTLPGEID